MLNVFALFILIFIGWLNPCDAAIAVDTNVSSNCSSCSSLTYSLTVGGGTNRLLVVAVDVTAYPGPSPSVSTVTYAGQNLTQIATYLNADTIDAGSFADQARIDQWYLINPPAGANNVVITLSGFTDAILSGATSLTGVNQSTPIRDNGASDSDGTSASTTISSADNDLVLDTVCNGTGVDSSNQNQQYILNVNTHLACNNIAGSTQAGASNVTMSWTVEPDLWVDFASSIEPASSGESYILHMGGGRLGGMKIGI